MRNVYVFDMAYVTLVVFLGFDKKLHNYGDVENL